MNSACNTVLQPDGAIVVNGKPIGSQADLLHTDSARYDPNDKLDASFGSSGNLTLTGVDVGRRLARQLAGKFILLGSASMSTTMARRVSILDAFPGRLRRVGCFATDSCAEKVYPSGAHAL